MLLERSCDGHRPAIKGAAGDESAVENARQLVGWRLRYAAIARLTEDCLVSGRLGLMQLRILAEKQLVQTDGLCSAVQAAQKAQSSAVRGDAPGDYAEAMYSAVFSAFEGLLVPSRTQSNPQLSLATARLLDFIIVIATPRNS